MSFKVKVRLAEIPSFALKEYHEMQVKVYSKITEFVFEALNSPSIRDWLEAFAERLGVKEIEIRLNRMSYHEAKLLPIELGKRGIFRPIGTFGRSSKRRPFIEVYPNPHFTAKTLSPTGVQA
ncbi:hypothetical protein KEJ32_01990 [Candidatus Bathyarchaeota archaeon]|nr:hypothetical protein [Candidatus Bathyarchaeota archaeon]